MSDNVFSVHPDNPRCFLYQDKPFKILTSAEHYGAVLNADFDYNIYLKEMKRTGQNATRVFTFYRETESSIPGPGGMNTLAPGPEASVMPWERVSGHGLAADGLDKFDLSRWNSAYFDRLKNYVEKCAENDVICEIVLFCNPYSQDKYDLFPCSKVSNVNGVGNDLDEPRNFMTLDAPSIVAFQEQFIRKMVEELNEFDNVYYEICNEPNLGGEDYEENEKKIIAWQSHLARAIRQAEREMPKKHLIAANAHFSVQMADDSGRKMMRHDDLSYFENPDIDIVNYHYISAKASTHGLHFVRLSRAHAGNIWSFLRHRDRFSKPIVFDETFSGIVRGNPEQYPVNRAEAWEMILSGGAGYSNLDWSFTPADETGSGKEAIGDGRKLDGRCLRDWLNILRSLLDEYEVDNLVPAVRLTLGDIPGCVCSAAAVRSGGYILYFVDERLYSSRPCTPRQLSVLINLPVGVYLARVYDPKTGDSGNVGMFHITGPARLKIPEFTEDIALLLTMLD